MSKLIPHKNLNDILEAVGRSPAGPSLDEIVRSRMDKKAASAFIKQRADQIATQDDRARFVEVAETEIRNLHEGNIVRYRLRPSEYRSWMEIWR